MWPLAERTALRTPGTFLASFFVWLPDAWAAVSAPLRSQLKVLFGSQAYDVTNSPRHRLPWQITGIRVTFSAAVTSGGIASLTGAAATGFSGLGTNTLTWTISPIATGSPSIALAGAGTNALTDANGIALGGGSGVTTALKVLCGDFNDDGVVNASDVAAINTAHSAPTYNIFADTNGDGVVDLTDVRLAGTRTGQTNP